MALPIDSFLVISGVGELFYFTSVIPDLTCAIAASSRNPKIFYIWICFWVGTKPGCPLSAGMTVRIPDPSVIHIFMDVPFLV
jgi:hypothetical protein